MVDYILGSEGLEAAEKFSSKTLVEGKRSLEQVYPQFKELDCPILKALYGIVIENNPIAQAIDHLLEREMRQEKI